MSYFDDPGYQERLVALIARDRQFLMQCAPLLQPDDFKPQAGAGVGAKERWVVAERSLDYWAKYKEPIGPLLPSLLVKHAQDVRLGKETAQGLVAYGKRILGLRLVGIQSLQESVIAYKKERRKADAVQNLIELQAAGELSDAKWLDVCRNAVREFDQDPWRTTHYQQGLEQRIMRRGNRGTNRYPAMLIDAVDNNIRLIARGHLGLVMAPLKRGKSMLLLWLALALSVQRLNVLYVTLEDPLQDLEDRFDSAVSDIKLQALNEQSTLLRERFANYRRLLRGRIELLDGTDKGMTVGMLEQAWLAKRDQGWTPDVLIVDYDDEIKTARKQDERRFEFADIYRSLRELAGRQNIFVWTAAQTTRKSEAIKALSVDYLAEDISKARKVSCALALGKGDWGEDSVYIYVAAHRNDKQHLGWNIYTATDTMLIYDRDRTLARMRAESLKKHQEATG